jgi:hypothetical protein
MTRKGRSKVRTQEPTPPPIDDLIAAGIVRVHGPESLTPKMVREAYDDAPEVGVVPDITPEQRQTLTDWLPALPTSVVDADGVDMAAAAASKALERLQDSTARLGLTADELSRTLVAGPDGAFGPLEGSRAGGKTAKVLAELATPSTIDIGELWYGRLTQMAQVADCTPGLYLNRLLSRAWTAMPRRDRTGR